MRTALWTSVAMAAWATIACAEPTLNLVLDLDGFILYNVHPRMERTRPERLIEADGSPWRVSDATETFLRSVTEIPGVRVRVSFFSARFAARNVAALKKIVVKEGQTAFDLAEGRLFHYDDLRRVEVSGRERGVKDLRVIPGAQLDWTILVDDDLGYAAPDQKRNLLHVPSTDYFHESTLPFLTEHIRYRRTENGINEVQHFLSYRNVMAYARGMLDTVLEIALRDGRAPASVLEGIQWTEAAKQRQWVPLQPLQRTFDYYRRGAAALRRTDRAYRFTTLFPGPLSCADRTMLSEWNAMLRERP